MKKIVIFIGIMLILLTGIVSAESNAPTYPNEHHLLGQYSGFITNMDTGENTEILLQVTLGNTGNYDTYLYLPNTSDGYNRYPFSFTYDKDKSVYNLSNSITNIDTITSSHKSIIKSSFVGKLMNRVLTGKAKYNETINDTHKTINYSFTLYRQPDKFYKLTEQDIMDNNILENSIFMSTKPLHNTFKGFNLKVSRWENNTSIIALTIKDETSADNFILTFPSTAKIECINSTVDNSIQFPKEQEAQLIQYLRDDDILGLNDPTYTTIMGVMDNSFNTIIFKSTLSHDQLMAELIKSKLSFCAINDSKSLILQSVTVKPDYPITEYETLSYYADGTRPDTTDGNVEYELGYRLYCGLENYSNGLLAARYFSKAAELDNIYGYYWLGRMHNIGNGVAKDREKASEYMGKVYQWIENSADKNDMVVQEMMGYLYLYGFGYEQDTSKAVSLFEASAQQGYGLAMHDLGSVYYTALEPDYARAFDYFKQSLNHGFPYAYLTIGMSYHSGNGASSNIREAIRWYKRSAETDNAEAYYNIGKIYFFGDKVSINYKKAYDYCIRGVNQENNGCLFIISYLYFKGYHVEQNFYKSLAYIDIPYKKGYLDAHGIRACILIDSENHRDYKQAYDIASAGANQGNNWCQNILGYMYYHGYYVESDGQKALYWFKKAAAQGNPVAIRNVENLE